MKKYAFFRTTYEYRVYTLTQKNFNGGRADACEEKKQCTYGLSDWFKVGQNQLKARQSRKKQVCPGLFEPKLVMMSAWPIAGLLGCVLYFVLHVSDFGQTVVRYTFFRHKPKKNCFEFSRCGRVIVIQSVFGHVCRPRSTYTAPVPVLAGCLHAHTHIETFSCCSGV